MPVAWTGQYNVVWTNAVSIPTGGERGFVIGPEAGFGNGWYEYSSSVLIIRRYDPLLVFGGFGTRYAFETEISGFDVTRGFAFDYQFGVGFGVNENMSLSAKLFGTFVTETKVNGQALPNSEYDLIALRFALTKANPNVICEPFVTIGLTEQASDAQVGMVFTFR